MSETKRIAFIPLESNPVTFTSLAHKLGLSKSLSFVDVYSLTDPDLLAFIPRPVHALILVFPTGRDYETKRNTEDAGLPELATSEQPAFFIKQTIQNACGLMALLHSVFNGSAKKHITEGSDFATLLKELEERDHFERAKLLETSPSLAAAHKDAAESGETEAPAADAEVDYHYVAFVRSDKDGKVYEMDGNRKGPVERAGVNPEAGDDLLASEDVRTVVQKLMQDTGSSHCGIVALVEGAE